MTDKGRPVRFLIVGAWNTLFGYLAFAAAYGLTRVLEIHYLFANVPAHFLAVGNAYLCHRTFTFGAGDAGAATSFFRFATVHWISLAVNLALLPLLVEGFDISPLVGAAILVVGSAFVSYFVHGRWSFARRA